VYDQLFYLTNALPLEAMAKLAEMPYIGNEKNREQVKNFQRLTTKMKDMQEIFFHFMN